MGLRVRNVHDIGRLQGDDGKALGQVLMLLEVSQWEAWREYDVYHHEIKPPHAEDSGVDEAAGLVNLEAFIQSVPLLPESRSVEVALVPEQEDHHEWWEDD